MRMNELFANLKPSSHAIIFGASGGIGSALLSNLRKNKQFSTIYAITRKPMNFEGDKISNQTCDLEDETSIQELVASLPTMDLAIIATGILAGDNGLMPEKNMQQINGDNLQKIFQINTVLPSLIAKHLLPRMTKDNKSIFAVLSARVGSITDNRQGGWYAYRTSKAALNMMMRNFSIEMARKNKQLVISMLQPGTVATTLAAPFSKNVPADHIFSPDYSANCLLTVLDSLTASDTGKFYDWAGKEIPW